MKTNRYIYCGLHNMRVDLHIYDTFIQNEMTNKNINKLWMISFIANHFAAIAAISNGPKYMTR